MAGLSLPAQNRGPEASSPPSPHTALGLPGSVASAIEDGNGGQWGRGVGGEEGSRSVAVLSQVVMGGSTSDLKR